MSIAGKKFFIKLLKSLTIFLGNLINNPRKWKNRTGNTVKIMRSPGRKSFNFSHNFVRTKKLSHEKNYQHWPVDVFRISPLTNPQKSVILITALQGRKTQERQAIMFWKTRNLQLSKGSIFAPYGDSAPFFKPVRFLKDRLT